MRDDQVSSTALTVIQGVLQVARHDPRRDLVAESQVAACQRILNATAEGRNRLKQLDNPLHRLLLRLMERLLLPGITRHYVLRKRYIEDAVRRSLDQGVTQLVVLGAGFDTLAWRLANEQPELTCIEIDHPATSRVKRAALEGEEEKRPNFHFLAVDLSRTPLTDVLTATSAFREKAPTVYVCEGVLMYLSEADVGGLLSTLRRLTRLPPRFVFTALEPMASPRNNTGQLLKWYLRFKGEGLNWELPREAIGGFLQRHGFQLTDSADGDALRQRYLAGDGAAGVHQGEYLVTARAEPAGGAGGEGA